jgi:thymidylate synthase
VKAYIDLIKHILENGKRRGDRTGTGTISVFGTQTRYDLRKGFPLLTTKKVLFPAVVRELLWFLKGSTNINDDLTQHTPIWDAWADEDGELGPVYGAQWRSWGGRGIDQIAQVIERIKTHPECRRHIVSAWNVEDVPKMALPPCHLMFQFYVEPPSPFAMVEIGELADTEEGREFNWRQTHPTLHCQMYQRSADMALGVPFNIASYALLLSMVANQCDMVPGVFVHTIGDAHIYLNHIEGLKRQIERQPYELPQLMLARKPLDEMTFEDIVLRNYRHHPFIKFKIAL